MKERMQVENKIKEATYGVEFAPKVNTSVDAEGAEMLGAKISVFWVCRRGLEKVEGVFARVSPNEKDGFELSELGIEKPVPDIEKPVPDIEKLVAEPTVTPPKSNVVEACRGV